MSQVESQPANLDLPLPISQSSPQQPIEHSNGAAATNGNLTNNLINCEVSNSKKARTRDG
jgi:hypothetical protein